jgi:hypothetical protein
MISIIRVAASTSTTVGVSSECFVFVEAGERIAPSACDVISAVTEFMVMATRMLVRGSHLQRCDIICGVNGKKKSGHHGA